jgi:hypothetical protein
MKCPQCKTEMVAIHVVGGITLEARCPACGCTTISMRVVPLSYPAFRDAIEHLRRYLKEAYDLAVKLEDLQDKAEVMWHAGKVDEAFYNRYARLNSKAWKRFDRRVAKIEELETEPAD